jgi:histidyl-tRNA synthetase
MDIVGVKSIAAEAELLSAITAFFINIGITSKDVGIKVNSRKVIAKQALKSPHIVGLFCPVAGLF